LQPDLEHPCHVGVGLPHRNARLEPRYALVAEVSQEQFVAIESHRQNQIHTRAEKAKIPRHHADHYALL